jgi:phytoene synthase
VGACSLAFRQRWAVLSAANIYGAIGRKVRQQAELAWDQRVHTSSGNKAGHVIAALREAITGSWEPGEWPHWTRGELMTMARMAGRPAEVSLGPVRDEGVRLKED